MIEQRSVAVRRRMQLLHQIREQLDVQLIDLDQLLDALFVALMVRNRVMSVRDADLAIGAVAAVAAHHERRHARHVGLPGNHLEIDHELGIVHVVVGHRARPFHVRQLRQHVAVFGNLDAALDVAHRVEVFVELALVARADLALQPRDAAGHVIEDALLIVEPRAPRGRIGAVVIAEQALEHRARIDLGRQRAGFGPPRHRHVRAGVSRVAIAGERLRLEAELHRRQLRVFAERFRRNLIGRDAKLEVRAAGLVRMHAGQERRRRPRVIARPVAKRASVRLREPAEHHDVLPIRLERLHRRAELEVRADGLGRPHELARALLGAADDAVWRVDVSEPHRRLSRGPRRRRRHGGKHRVEHGQGQCRPEAS